MSTRNLAHQMLSESLLSLSQAARRVPPYRGRQTAPSTVFRWLTAGVKLGDGTTLRLEGLRLAGRWLVSVEGLDRFLAAQHAACCPADLARAQTPVRTPGQRRRAAERAATCLSKYGI